MKITLAFDIYNKEKWIESILHSWISNLSGENQYEIIIVFDACKDRSEEIARNFLSQFNYEYKFLHADDKYEIYCNNLALQHATGDYIVFIQDDNWIYDKDWDLIFTKVVGKVDNVGTVGFLAGIQALPDSNNIKYQRIEIDRPHKGENFSVHNLPTYETGVWQVDAICRPFCVSRALLLSYGGLDTAFSPTCGDDLDLSLKLLRDGKVNLYIPFDLLNICGEKQTMQSDLRDSSYRRAFFINHQRHDEFLINRIENNTKVLIPLSKDQSQALKFPEDNFTNIKNANITFFALPKTFQGKGAITQRNAIKSWLSLDPVPEIILFGEDKGVAEIANEFNLKHIPHVRGNEYGAILVNDLFEKAQIAASNDILVYINSDIILLSDFIPAVRQVSESFNEFLMIGQRWDTDISEPINFDEVDWENKLKAFIRQNAYLHSVTGIDYFVFTKDLWHVIPAFGLGRTAWDNWLAGRPIEEGKSVIDATERVMAIHQDHKYVPFENRRKEEVINRKLAGATVSMGFISNATWKLTDNGLMLRHVGEFLRNKDLLIALRCIENAYCQSPEIVEKQLKHIMNCYRPESLNELLKTAKTFIASGIPFKVPQVILNNIGQRDKAAAVELYKKGIEYLRQADAHRAINCFNKAVIECEDLPDLHYAHATALVQIGYLFKAKQACQMELLNRPDHDGAKRLLERIEQAINEYEQSLIS